MGPGALGAGDASGARATSAAGDWAEAAVGAGVVLDAWDLPPQALMRMTAERMAAAKAGYRRVTVPV